MEPKEDGTYGHKVPKETIGASTSKAKGQDSEKAKNHFCYVCIKTASGKADMSPTKGSVRQPA